MSLDAKRKKDVVATLETAASAVDRVDAELAAFADDPRWASVTVDHGGGLILLTDSIQAAKKLKSEILNIIENATTGTNE